MVSWLVVLLCGPPGAGKTTAARASGLDVFDRDDPRWTSDRHFDAALSALGRSRDARAVVIRSGATRAAREATARQVGATHIYAILGEDHARRIANRGRADARQTVAGVRYWFDRFDGDVEEFPGWESVIPPDRW